jgi:hypothetical protein
MTNVTKSGKKGSMSASRSTLHSRGRFIYFRVQEACLSRKVVTILAAKFVFFLGALNAVLLSPAGRAFVDGISQANARISAALLEFCGIETEVQNATIFSDSTALTVLGGSILSLASFSPLSRCSKGSAVFLDFLTPKQTWRKVFLHTHNECQSQKKLKSD